MRSFNHSYYGFLPKERVAKNVLYKIEPVVKKKTPFQLIFIEFNPINLCDCAY